ncbi:acetyl-CoA carboxylase carboxyltransferase subunit alpha [Desemzia sp. RIT804]|uniref:acetyl-CoA carboxylase carboxyltransferase subunit alpha n=1 Tax=Desemzia sp. RIT 804 TaxID=2810209 RepID=UPI00195016EF|nr:acetyl-CoA carboxylase carboxyltransferase subunit alpha [Desemzia sp. RIT 804]MBM6613937.1 acetyl-CoA carboxylase carboxyltransferase subunit alpha [Desemzia sp. RIT 804]
MVKAIEIVERARKISRLNTLDIVSEIFEDFIELHGDRLFRDDKAIVGGIATLNGTAVTVIGNQKEHDLKENIRRNFGSPHPEGYRKSLRLMKQAEKFNRPVINFINTAGAYCGVEAEDRGQGEAIARNLLEMSQLKVPILSIILGEGGSGGALALAMGNEVWMMENSMYSVLSPEGFSSILWKDASRAKEAAEVMKLTPDDLMDLSVIDKIIPESHEGENLTQQQVLLTLKTEIVDFLSAASKKTSTELINERYEKFRAF